MSGLTARWAQVSLSMVAAGCVIACVAACSANSGPQIRVADIGGGGGGGAGGTVAAAPVVHFLLTPDAVSQGQSTTATWDTQGATGCIGNGSWSGSLPLSNTAGFVLGPFQKAGTFAYGVSCSGAGGTTAVTQTLMVGAVPAPVVTFALAPSSIAPGSSATLIWSTANATACTASGGTGSDGWSGNEALQNQVGFNTGAITTAGEYQYDLACSGVGGSSEQSLVLTVSASAPPAQPALTWTVTPQVIQPGQSTVFTWVTTGASACTASGGGGADGWGGVVPTSSQGTTVGPIATVGSYSYTLNCSGPGGSVGKSVTVVVSAAQAPAPSVVIDVNPAQITAGGSAALTWNSANADACTASGSWSGAETLMGSNVSTGTLTTAAVYSYTLVCNGAGGSVSGTATLDVTPAPATVANFVASPAVIVSGQTSSLSWTTTGATACTASGGTGSDGWGGAVSITSSGTPVGPINTAGTYAYTLTCSGPGGASAPQSVSVTVNPATPSVPTVSGFTATPNSIVVGQASVLTWTSNGATTCTGGGGTGADGWNGSVGTSSAGTSTGPIAVAGAYVYTLNCSGAGGNSDPASVIVNVTNPASAAASVVSFSASPSTVQTGQASSLSWSTSNANSCTASGGTGTDGWGGRVATSSSGTTTGPIAGTGNYTYTLNCSGAGGASTPASVIVNVTAAPLPPATVTSLSATPTTLQTGQSTQFAWTSNGATSCAATGGSNADQWTGSVGTSNTGDTIGPLTTAGNYVYTLTCSGPGGSSAPTSITIDVNSAPPAPSVASFAANPTAVQVGGSTTLTWSSNNATACAASGGAGGDGWSGAMPAASQGTAVGPLNSTGTVTYTLTCSGAGGTSAPSSISVSVTAAPPAASVSNFRATPTATQTGQSSLLSWTSGNATSCTASGGSGADNWTGSMPTSSTGLSTGALQSPGTYVYGLVCTGPGGPSPLSSATVTVTNAMPVATVTTFTAMPNTLQTGQSTQLAWSSNAASACTGSGGTGTDGWVGAKPVSNADMTVGPYNTAGTYTYTLTCTGPGGTGAPSSVNVTVNAAPAAASVLSFTATPSTVTAGQSTSLSWTTTAATSCTASGGTGADGWGGATGTSSAGTSVGPLPTAGTITYTLTCVGTGGTSAPSSTNVKVTAATPSQPTVTLSANGASAATIQPGASVTLSWSSTNSTSCSASGGSGSGWAGTQSTASSGVVVGPIAAPGVYDFTLTCQGPGGSGSSTVAVTVLSTNSGDCGVGMPTTNLVSPAASATSVVQGVCLGCSVLQVGNVISSAQSSYATMSLPLGVGGTTGIRVTDAATFPAGRKVGFIVAEGNTLLSLGVLQAVSVVTALNGVPQETSTTSSTLTLQAVGAISIDPTAGFIEFSATKPFNSVEVVAGGLASALTTYKVYEACVSLQ